VVSSYRIVEYVRNVAKFSIKEMSLVYAANVLNIMKELCFACVRISIKQNIPLRRQIKVPYPGYITDGSNK